MKPFGQLKRPKDWLPIVNFAIAEGIPREINLRDHLFPYVGCEPDPAFIWGVYGTTSINMAIYGAAQTAAAAKKRSLQLTSWLQVDNFNSGDAIGGTYLHLGRTTSEQRDVIRKGWALWVHDNIPGQASLNTLLKLDLETLASRFPSYARVYLQENPEVIAMVHPVSATYAVSKPSAPLWVLTARYNKDLIKASEVRFVSDVDVNLW